MKRIISAFKSWWRRHIADDVPEHLKDIF